MKPLTIIEPKKVKKSHPYITRVKFTLMIQLYIIVIAVVLSFAYPIIFRQDPPKLLSQIFVFICIACFAAVGPYFARKATLIYTHQDVATAKAFQLAWWEVKSMLTLFPIIGPLFLTKGVTVEPDTKVMEDIVKPDTYE